MSSYTISHADLIADGWTTCGMTYDHTVHIHTIDHIQLIDDTRAIIQSVVNGITTVACVLAMPVAILAAIGTAIVRYTYRQAMLGYNPPRRIPVNAVPDTDDVILVYHGQDTLDLPIESTTILDPSCNRDGYPVDPDCWPDCGLVAYPLSDWSTIDPYTVAACDAIEQPADPIKPVKVPTPVVETPALAPDQPSMTWTKARLQDRCEDQGITFKSKHTKQDLLDMLNGWHR